MRFLEFAPAATPILKISQQQLQQQRLIQQQQQSAAAQIPTPTVPTSPPKPTVKVYPKAWQHAWVQKHLAAQIGRDVQTVEPTEMDIIKAFIRHADVQRQADQNYQRATAIPDEELGWQGEHRWVKRD